MPLMLAMIGVALDVPRGLVAGLLAIFFIRELGLEELWREESQADS